jgi:hypothetical protein
MANPGPSTTVTTNSQAVTAPIVTPLVNTNAGPVQGTNALRLIAAARGVSLAALGDAAVIPVINTSLYNPFAVIITNAQLAGVGGSVATAALSINTGPAVTGVSVVANAALTTLTSQYFVLKSTVVAATLTTAIPVTLGTNQNIYINVGTALATATVDIFVWGYDLT